MHSSHTMKMKSGSKAAAAEEEKTIMELIAAHLDIAMAWEVSSTPLKFHDQISALWEYDKTIQPSDADVDYGAAHAAMLRDDLIFEIPEPAKYRQAVAADHPKRDKGWRPQCKESARCASPRTYGSRVDW